MMRKEKEETEASWALRQVEARNIDEAYRLTPHERIKALKALGVEPQFIGIDLFASSINAVADLYITQTMDAFTYDWSLLKLEGKPFLWANPPFSMMEKVVSKLCLEPCQMVLCAPEWRDYPWWKPLDHITVARVYLPPNCALYVPDGSKHPLPPPNWRTMLSLVDTVKWPAPSPTEEQTSWVRSHCLGKGLPELLREFSRDGHGEVLVTTRSGRVVATPEEDEGETDVPSSSSSLRPNSDPT